ncbi:uncharacterized protein [Argopecten irradians]|uniref:uncharacterized protein n=1 Tax=Argopecten irradians TaxID=31199 RepID=UPI0037113418
MADQWELCGDSWILYHVLDRMMGNKEKVAIRRKMTLVEERLESGEKQSFLSFIVGSSSEGVDMKGSDKDILYSDKEVVVICPDQNITPAIADKTVFVMRDANSRPGYVTLELIKMAAEFVRSSSIHSIVPVGNSYFISSEMYIRTFVDIATQIFQYEIASHGPAGCALNESNHCGFDVDFVSAFHCNCWPKEANEWLNRPRLLDWPDKRLRHQIVQGGCYLVPVGDKTSNDTFLQWRISFVIAERKLVHSFNHVQFLVYCLLKYFLKQISDKLKSIYGEADIITSYILKTVLFYALENTSQFLWQERNIFLCFMFCLNILLTWVKTAYCPNYFIRNHNMFSGKINLSYHQNLIWFLDELRGISWGCLSVGSFFEPTIGQYMKRVKHGEWELVLPTPARLERERDVLIFMKTFSFCIGRSYLYQALALLYKSNTDTDEFVAYITSLRALFLNETEAFNQNSSLVGNKQKYKSLRKCKMLMTPLASACTCPGLLTLATYHYQTGNYTKTLEMCRGVISSKIIYVHARVNEMEEDTYEDNYCSRGYDLLLKCQQAFGSGFQLNETSWQFCPSKLQPELAKIRLGAQLSIPPLPYAVFLMFLCYHDLGDTRRRDTALIDLRAMKYDEYQGRRRWWIVHNLLGICYEMVGDKVRARKEYEESLGGERPGQYNNPSDERITHILQEN